MSCRRSLLLLTLVGLWLPSPTSAAEGELIDFTLEDQFGSVHRRADVAGSVVLLIGSDKGGSQFNGAWDGAIDATLGDHPRYGEISHLAYADLRGVPFFLKGMIRGKFPEAPESWVMLDWKGVFAKAYDFVAKSSNILVFSQDGVLLHHAAGREPDDAAVGAVVEVLRDALDEHRD